MCRNKFKNSSNRRYIKNLQRYKTGRIQLLNMNRKAISISIIVSVIVIVITAAILVAFFIFANLSPSDSACHEAVIYRASLGAVATQASSLLEKKAVEAIGKDLHFLPQDIHAQEREELNRGKGQRRQESHRWMLRTIAATHARLNSKTS